MSLRQRSVRWSFPRGGGRRLLAGTTGVVPLLAGLVVVLGFGSGAAVCKLRYDCRVGAWLHPMSKAEQNTAALEQMVARARSAPAARVGPAFSTRVAAGGFSLPTDFAFLSPDRLLVSEKAGRVVQYDLRTGRRTVVLDLRDRVDDTGFRGLVTVAVDPDFASNQRIYVIYVLKPHTETGEAATTVRLSSFRLRDGHAGHERILLGRQPGPCGNRLARTSDCYPAYVDHVGGQIAFAADGTLFVATGDGGGKPHASLALDPDSIAGKILHINRNGNGLSANPFWNGNGDANRSKVWALGLRNPFRLTLDPKDGTPIVGDVGDNRLEEIDAAPKGANLGWPCREGPLPVAYYAHASLCRSRTLSASRPAANLLLVTLPHTHGSETIVGGAFAPHDYPKTLQNAYFYASWVHGWIRTIQISDHHRTGPQHPFATNLPGPIAIHPGPDGALWILCLNSGDLRRISYHARLSRVTR